MIINLHTYGDEYTIRIQQISLFKNYGYEVILMGYIFFQKLQKRIFIEIFMLIQVFRGLQSK